MLTVQVNYIHMYMYIYIHTYTHIYTHLISMRPDGSEIARFQDVEGEAAAFSRRNAREPKLAPSSPLSMFLRVPEQFEAPAR